jgi:hypothetical protein
MSKVIYQKRKCQDSQLDFPLPISCKDEKRDQHASLAASEEDLLTPQSTIITSFFSPPSSDGPSSPSCIFLMIVKSVKIAREIPFNLVWYASFLSSFDFLMKKRVQQQVCDTLLSPRQQSGIALFCSGLLLLFISFCSSPDDLRAAADVFSHLSFRLIARRKSFISRSQCRFNLYDYYRSNSQSAQTLCQTRAHSDGRATQAATRHTRLASCQSNRDEA